MSTNQSVTCPHAELIRSHAACQAGMYLNGTYRDKGWFGGFSRVVSDMFWNFATPLAVPDGSSSNGEMYKFFKDLRREPALYGETEFITESANSLGLDEFEVSYKDLWMEHSSETISVEETEHEIKDIREGASVKDFTSVFTDAYGDSSADDPYGGLPETYMDALKNGLETSQLGDYDSHLVGYDGEQPISIGSIIGVNGVAIIYNMGTLPERQGEGVGSRIAERLISKMREAGYDRILLQTEPGSYVEDFYSQLGFEAVFEASGITSDDWTARFQE